MAIPFTFEVRPSSNWGSAKPASIQGIAETVASLLSEGSQAILREVVIEHHADVGSIQVPVTYLPNPTQPKYTIRLFASNQDWGQYAWQIAHEIAHLLENLEVSGYLAGDPGLWLLDTINEVASIQVLRKLHEKWQRDNPSATANLSPFYCVYWGGVKANDGMMLSDWLGRHGASLRTENYALANTRGLIEEVVPLFDRYYPECWRATESLHLDFDSKDTVAVRFDKWLDRVSKGSQAEFVKDLRALFQVVMK